MIEVQEVPASTCCPDFTNMEPGECFFGNSPIPKVDPTRVVFTVTARTPTTADVEVSYYDMVIAEASARVVKRNGKIQWEWCQ